MKLCIPTIDAKGIDSIVSDHFGSAPYFTLFDTESNEIAATENPHGEHTHGGCMPVAVLKTLQADAVLCKGMGARAVGLLGEAGIKALLVDAKTVSEAIEQFKAKSTRSLDAETACRRHECHSKTE
ncbi:MAG: NifB/NifX family molybdenum-iron cluster-binding protein [Candidatus Eisenbacteria bacterium]|nr:NifB/NifX family molybdenum-iron cluster-binding protein [Candidatus Eisenbacteria bacterium]